MTGGFGFCILVWEHLLYLHAWDYWQDQLQDRHYDFAIGTEALAEKESDETWYQCWSNEEALDKLNETLKKELETLGVSGC